MAYQSIGLGSAAGDGTGDTLRVGGDKVNDNFVEIYTLLGTGTALTSGISASSSVVTLAGPSITGVAAFANSGTNYLTISNSSNDAVITSGVQDKDIIFKGDDGGSAITALTLDMSDAGAAVFGGNIKVPGYIWSTTDGEKQYFGANAEISVTHVHDVGLTLTNTNTGDDKPFVLQLKSEEDAITANEVIASIELAAGDANAPDGATVAAGIHAIAEGEFTSSANPTKLVFTTGVSETAASSATAKMTLSSAGLLTIADDFIIKDGGTIGSASDADAISIASNGVVTFSQIPVMPANSIDSDEYIDGSIDTAHIGDDQITQAKMANDSVGSAELKTLSTLLIKNSGGTTLATFHTAGA